MKKYTTNNSKKAFNNHIYEYVSMYLYTKQFTNAGKANISQ